MENLEDKDYIGAPEAATDAVDAGQFEEQYPELDDNIDSTHTDVEGVMGGLFDADAPGFAPYAADNNLGDAEVSEIPYAAGEIDTNQLSPEINQDIDWTHNQVDNVMVGNQNTGLSYAEDDVDNEEDEDLDASGGEDAYRWNEENLAA